MAQMKLNSKVPEFPGMPLKFHDKENIRMHKYAQT
jgi:hypothetical protein